MSDVTENTTPRPPDPALPKPRKERAIPRASSGRILLCYFLAIVFLALLQAPRLAGTLEEFAGDIPQAEEIARALRDVGEHSGLNALGEEASALFTRLSPALYLGAVDGAAGSLHVAGGGTSPENTPAADATDTAAPAQHNGAANASIRASSDQSGNSISASPHTALAARNSTAQTPPAGNATAAATDATPFASDKPLVLLIGDSMMMEGLGPAMLRNLRTREDIAVIREAKYSTGLSRKDYFDWPGYMESLVKKHNPAVVVISLGGNDAQDIVDDNKKRHIVATESWGEQYRERASLLLQAAQKEGASVIWVGLPIMGQPTHAKRSLQLCVQQEAACADNSPCVYVDTLQLLTDSKGAFTAFVKGGDGKQVRTRHKDKIHVTTAGGEILTKAVLPELDKLLEAQGMGDGNEAQDANAATDAGASDSARASEK